MFAPFDVETASLETAYTYWTDRVWNINSDLDVIYRENNAVEGWEENVKAEARSLSVGDVIHISDGHVLNDYFSVDTMGFSPVLEADALIAQQRGRNAAR